MRMKSIIALFVALVFSVSLVGLGFAAVKEVKGTVAKIAGKRVSVKEASGKTVTVVVKNAKELKVGDNVVIKGGTATKEAAAAAAPAAPAPKPAAKKPASGGY